ncbi:discoidin domain-containing protein, partial [Kitasatospora albolonga]
MRALRWRWRAISAVVATSLLMIGVPSLAASAADGPNLAAGRAAAASSAHAEYPAPDITDGNASTYWESAGGSLPQWVQTDLGSAARVDEVTLKLPPSWESRTQTLSLQGSADGTGFATLKSPAAYSFTPGAANTVKVTFPATLTRFVRVHITANTGSPSAQLAELEVYGPATGDTQAPTAPSDLAFTEPATGQIRLTWKASTDNTGVTGYDIYADNTLLASVAGDVTTYTDTRRAGQTVTYHVRARDAAGNVSPDSNTVTRTGDTGDTQAPTAPTALAFTEPAAGQIRLSWQPSTDNKGVTGYDIHANNVLRGSVAGNVLTYTDTQPATATVSYTVRAKDAAGNVSTDSNTVTRNGSTGAASNLAVNKPITASSVVHTYVAAHANDNSTATYWEGAGGSYPNTLTVRLGSNADTQSVVVKLNPDSSWGPRTQRIEVLGREQSSSSFNSLVAARDYAFSPASGNTVTIPVAARIADVQLKFTANSGTAPVTLGTWTAANGSYTLRTVLAADANELPVKRENNTSTESLFVGRGAHMPYDMYEAEDGTTGGGARVVGPDRTVGDIAGEASGRKAVTLDSTGNYVEFTTRKPTTRWSPGSPSRTPRAAGGIDSTLNIYVDGTFLKAIDLTSKYAWLYGNEAAPGNSPSAGAPRHIYDEANVMLGRTVPAGAKIRLQKDAANSTTYAIDFISLEQVAPAANPNPATYTVPAGFTHQDVQNALDRVRMDTTGNLTGVYLPPGEYSTASKFQVYGKAVEVVGAGPWYTRFNAPATQDNTDIGFRAEASAKGSSFANFAYFGNYTSRIDGPGKVFDFANVSDIVIDNIWNEHMVCLYWGANTDNITIKNSRIRNMFADGINMTNGSTDNLVTNNEARATGDDSFALFSAIDAGGADMKNNVYENLTSILTWRAAGVAVYGGYDNTFRNIHIADTLVYSGITVSLLDFGYPMNGFGTRPTRIENVSIVRSGGHFWGSQTFPGIWLFSASKVFQGIRISNVDIVDPTYSGIMFQTNYVGGQPQFPIKDTVLTDISISGARKSGDAFDAKSGFGLWANEMPEAGQGPAVGGHLQPAEAQRQRPGHPEHHLHLPDRHQPVAKRNPANRSEAEPGEGEPGPTERRRPPRGGRRAGSRGGGPSGTVGPMVDHNPHADEPQTPPPPT